MSWRNLYLAPSKELLNIINKKKIRYAIDDFGNVVIRATEEIKWEVVDTFFKKKGMVFKDHGDDRFTVKFT